VIDDIPTDELNDRISKVAYDFFDEEPEKVREIYLFDSGVLTSLGARGYFLHHILHDWSDKYCHLILRRIREAMAPGYSKLLIHELVLPVTGAAEIQATFDLVMMTFNGRIERSKSQWTKLLAEAGFVIITFWEHFDHDGINEAEIACGVL
jgi:hypothetical protein